MKLHDPHHATYEVISARREYRYFGLQWRWRLIRTGIRRILGDE